MNSYFIYSFSTSALSSPVWLHKNLFPWKNISFFIIIFIFIAYCIEIHLQEYHFVTFQYLEYAIPGMKSIWGRNERNSIKKINGSTKKQVESSLKKYLEITVDLAIAFFAIPVNFSVGRCCGT